MPHSSVGAQFGGLRRGIDLHPPAHLPGRVLRELPLRLPSDFQARALSRSAFPFSFLFVAAFPAFPPFYIDPTNFLFRRICFFPFFPPSSSLPFAFPFSETLPRTRQSGNLLFRLDSIRFDSIRRVCTCAHGIRSSTSYSDGAEDRAPGKFLCSLIKLSRVGFASRGRTRKREAALYPPGTPLFAAERDSVQQRKGCSFDVSRLYVVSCMRVKAFLTLENCPTIFGPSSLYHLVRWPRRSSEKAFFRLRLPFAGRSKKLRKVGRFVTKRSRSFFCSRSYEKGVRLGVERRKRQSIAHSVFGLCFRFEDSVERLRSVSRARKDSLAISVAMKFPGISTGASKKTRRDGCSRAKITKELGRWSPRPVKAARNAVWSGTKQANRN